MSRTVERSSNDRLARPARNQFDRSMFIFERFADVYGRLMIDSKTQPLPAA
jgi:hypothetical protein